MLIFLGFFFNEYKTKENFVTMYKFQFCKIIFSSYLAQWYSTLIKVTCPMNVHEFQCWHRSLLFLDRIGFETAALEVSFFFSKWIFQHTGSTPSRFGPLRRSISKFPIEPSSSSVYNTWWLFQSTKKGNWSLSSLEFNELYFIISKCSLPPGRYWRHVAFGGLLSSRPVKILFLTSELANKAEIYVLSARDTTTVSYTHLTLPTKLEV